MVKNISQHKFLNQLEELSDHLELSDSSLLKIDFIIPSDQPICFSKVGFKEKKWKKSQVDVLNHFLSSHLKFQSGKHRGQEINTTGLLYLKIDGGRIVNFYFKRCLFKAL